MIVYDVLVDGRVMETIQPVNQRRIEMYWSMIDRVDELRKKYNNFTLSKRRSEVL